jgi:multiple sugar transport system substrate-binding protein
MRKIHKTGFAVALAAAVVLAGCSSPGSTEPADGGDGTEATATAPTDGTEADTPEPGTGDGEAVTLEYWLWDANQTPQYQACADAFTAANPSVNVNITQTGWVDYWNNLTNNLAAGTGPDVFINHLNYFPQFLNDGVIVDLQPLIDRDGVDMSGYYPSLADLWKNQDGDSFGLPKDWDTVALFYNSELMEAAGYTQDDLWALEWNPEDGGTYEQMIAHLTVDENGVRGDEPGFDKTKVATYGIAMEINGAGFSQAQLSPYFFSTDWQFTDKNPWGTKYNFDDPRYKDTVAWWQSMIDKGYTNTIETMTSMDGNALDSFGAGKFAIVPNGDWMMSSFEALPDVTVAYAPTPIGPSGKRASMFNGLTDAINAASAHQEEAWEWVKFLGSVECQLIVAGHGVVFPAQQAASDEALRVAEEKGRDISAFMVHVDEGTTFAPPITMHYADVLALMNPVFDAIMQGQETVDALDDMNQKINALFE